MRRGLVIVGGLIGLLLGALAGYHYRVQLQSIPQNSATPSTAVTVGGQRFIRWQTPRPLPAFTFRDEMGRMLTLEDFRGRVVLLNVWATWCPPCRAEMPSLDRLQSKRGGPRFEVVALSIGEDEALVKSFYRQVGIKALRIYRDPDSGAMSALGIAGIPATLLIGRDGREMGRALGPAEWDNSDVLRLIDDALNSRADT